MNCLLLYIAATYTEARHFSSVWTHVAPLPFIVGTWDQAACRTSTNYSETPNSSTEEYFTEKHFREAKTF